MKILRSKSKVSSVALVLVLTIAATLITCLPTAMAEKAPTKAFLSFRPNPIGRGQMLLINAWVSPCPEWSTMLYHDYNFIFTKPDGTVETIVIPYTEQPGTVWFLYIPDKLGTWTIQFTWAGQADREPCSTEKLELIVQQEPIPSWPPAELPTDGWDYPINIENREWAQISGPWFMMDYNASRCDWNPYTQGPRSSHILWRLPPLSGVGGLIGGLYGTTGYYTKNTLTVSVVMAGRAYSTAGGNIICVDVRTGEILWRRPGSFNVGAIRGTTTAERQQAAGAPPSTVGMSGTPALYSFEPYGYNRDNIVGPEIPYTRFIVYDGLTGAVTLNVKGLPICGGRGGLFEDPFVYSFYNFTSDGYPYQGNYARMVKWDTRGNSENFEDRIVLNITWPFSNLYWRPPTLNGDYLAYAVRPTNLTTPDAVATHTISLGVINKTTGQLIANYPVADWSQSSGSDSMGSMWGKMVSLL